MTNFLQKAWMYLISIAFVVGSIFMILAVYTKDVNTRWTVYNAPDSSKWEIQKETGKIRPLVESVEPKVDSEGNAVLGAGYSPVTGYQTLTTSRVSASATTIPVASVSDRAGHTIATNGVSSSSTVRMYFNFEPGTSREEPFYCTGISSLNLTGCVRGIAFQGSDLSSSSTIAQIHNAGSPIIMTNLGVFYGNEFVSTAGTQTIYDVKTFVSFPEVSSTTALPTSNGQFATKYYADSVGAGGFTSANVSSTLGLTAYAGVPSCPSAAACVGINASSTSGLSFNLVTGALQLDPAMNLYLTGNFKFTGNVTSSGIVQVQNPTSTLDAANKSYVDQQVAWNEATGTAGMAITAGNAVFISSTSTLFQTNTNVASSTFHFVGIANNTVSNGGTVKYTKIGGMNCNLTSLSPGNFYYLSGSSGGVAITPPGANMARIGQALNANCIEVLAPKYTATGTITISGTGNTFVNTGFFPAHITIRAGWDQKGVGSIGDDGNTAVIFDGNSVIGWTTTSSFQVMDTVIYCLGTVSAKSESGFTINTSRFSVNNSQLQWVATSD